LVAAPTGGEPRSLAEKLDRLFKTIHSPRRREYTYEEVAEGVRRQGIATISGTYIWELRTGQKDNPRKHHLEALAKFFDVPVGYFFNDDEVTAQIYAQLALLAAMRDARVRNIATRAATLSPLALEAIAEMITRLQQIEGTTEARDEPGGEPTDGRGAES
jgi:transcriptional regulator with XRE-family HTH domain